MFSMLRFGLFYKAVTIIIIIVSSFSTYSQQTWIQVSSPDNSETRNLLNGISGTTSSDVWVVGEFELSSPGNLRNLIMYWNGSGWQIFPGTDLSSSYNVLWDITAIAADDVWAAGTYNEPGTSRSQLLHWNGSAWSHTQLPNIPGGSFLFAIDAIAANDIWAVGGQAGSPTKPPYSIHYDGTSWTEFQAALPGAYRNWFNDVDGIASNDVWAVGRQSPSYGEFHAMAQHWDGSSWTNSSLPPAVLSLLGELESVTMISSDDVWALGSTAEGDIIMIHWNGTNWSEVSSTGSAGGSIVAREPDIFAVGDRISQWDGTSWTVIDSLNQLANPSLVSTVTFSNGDIWAAGRTIDTCFHTLVYRTVSEPLPVVINYYFIRKTGGTATMEWRTSSEFNAMEFVMERSTDGVDFIPIVHMAAQGSGHDYVLVDPSPLRGRNYYRLRLIDRDGRITTFPIKSLNFDSQELKPFTVYPNPVDGRELRLLLKREGDYHILILYDMVGKQVTPIKVSSSTSSILLNLPESLHSGVYILTLADGGVLWSEKILIN